ncbi:MAG: histidinol dehydrogenase [Kiritimatiellae bacterium]|nr:histidinol dehydrogenase [Kiritimatiellia bacterium]
MNIPIYKWSPHMEAPEVEAFLERRSVDADAEAVAREVLDAVRAEGDAAVARYTEKFNGACLVPREFAVGKDERMAAVEGASLDLKRALREVDTRVSRFAKAGQRKDWSMATPKGGVLGEIFTPLRRVGVYVPGGAAPLVSTVMMTIPLARVAGVQEIVACTPCGPDGRVNPDLLCALEVAGATEVYRVGGIQAIGAMAYGTGTIAKVQKIVGPGGPFVAAAKKLVYGEVDLDMVAGPSEIAIVADESAPAAYVAADFLSQLEHGSGREKALLATVQMSTARRVQEEIERQMRRSGRAALIERAAEHGAAMVVCDTVESAVELVNRFAPEHCELMVREPRRWVRKMRNAGAVFVGSWTPECAGDFVAGPSHVLPTGGTAACWSGLTVDSFRKRTSVISFTRADLLDARWVIEKMGGVEGLDGHVRSATVRFEASGLEGTP